MSAPTVSVIVPTFNRRDTLPRALDSIVNQTFPDWEIILVDDGSTDGTRHLAAEYEQRLGKKFRYMFQKNCGAGHARNRGINAARGRYVAFLDSDDEFLPRKLERQMALFRLCPELGLVYCDYSFVSVDGVWHNSAFDAPDSMGRKLQTESVAPGLHLCTQDLFDVLIRRYFICTNSGVIRRDVLGSAIRFREDLTFGEEWLFYLQVARACPAGFVDEPLTVYHHHYGSLARSDRARNAREYLHLLRAMHRTFDGLSTVQRRILSGHLAQLCRQLGHTAYRDGCYKEALARFAESFRYAPRATTLCEALQAAARRLLAWPRPASCKAHRFVSSQVAFPTPSSLPYRRSTATGTGDNWP